MCRAECYAAFYKEIYKFSSCSWRELDVFMPTAVAEPNAMRHQKLSFIPKNLACYMATANTTRMSSVRSTAVASTDVTGIPWVGMTRMVHQNETRFAGNRLILILSTHVVACYETSHWASGLVVGLLWMRLWAIEFHKMLRSSWVAIQPVASWEMLRSVEFATCKTFVGERSVKLNFKE
jgi:hypothetical protein